MNEGPKALLIRFVAESRHLPYGNRNGVLKVAYDLSHEHRLSDNAELDRLLLWFRDHLAIPHKFTVSKHPRAKGTAISWIRDSAHEHIGHLRALVTLLDSAGIQTEELRTTRPGYVVYEDAHQVVALPFSDTPR